eukprot:2431203-Pyramimonas_sp.AAC.1
MEIYIAAKDNKLFLQQHSEDMRATGDKFARVVTRPLQVGSGQFKEKYTAALSRVENALAWPAPRNDEEKERKAAAKEAATKRIIKLKEFCPTMTTLGAVKFHGATVALGASENRVRSIDNCQASAEKWLELIDAMAQGINDDFDVAKPNALKLLSLVPAKHASSKAAAAFSRTLKAYIQALAGQKVHLVIPGDLRPFVMVLAVKGDDVVSQAPSPGPGSSELQSFAEA